MIPAQLEHHTAEVGGVTLHYVAAGAGKPVILLHGFPEFWYGWRHQIGPLAESGLRVIVPDQRGYNESDKPRDVAAYRLDVLADDVAGLMDALGLERAAVVGHDWGGIVAWWLAARQPGRVDRLAILNAPHPFAFRRLIRSSPSQMLKSWYTFVFQIPWLPEAVLRARGGAMLRRMLRGTGRPGAFTEAELDAYAESWSRPGALTAMINWYRAPLPKAQDPSAGRVAAPTLVIWGARDAALDRSLAEASLSWCERGRLETLDDATHWVQHEEGPRVNRLLLEFLHPDDEPGPGPSPPPHQVEWARK